MSPACRTSWQRPTRARTRKTCRLACSKQMAAARGIDPRQSAPVASQRVARHNATTGARVGHRAARMRTRARQPPQLDTFVLVRPHTRAHPPSRGVPRACPPARLAFGRFLPRCRFYKAAGVAQVEQDDARTGTLKTVWALTLDGRHVRTPANKVSVFCVFSHILSACLLPAAGRELAQSFAHLRFLASPLYSPQRNRQSLAASLLSH